GIPRDKQARMFEAFEQADTSTTREYGGTGLGLAISKQLVELMHGEIGIESEVGKGTTFRFTVRLKLQPKPAADRRESQQDYLQGLRVLVVDDNETNRFILQEITSVWGMKPAVASSVDEAIATLEKAQSSGQPIQLVLTDMYMPRRDGFALIEWLRGRLENADVKDMILSSGPTAEHRARATAMQVTSYLTKPVRQSTLFDAIATAIGPAEVTSVAPSAAPAVRQDHGGRPLQILLAEDNPVNQMTATTMFEKLGHAVTVANNGRQAIDRINEQQFDVVFMDVQMPEMDGVTATCEIRKREQATGRHIPIVAMTAHAMKGDKEKCLEAGMDDYVSKPIRGKDLGDVLARIVERFLTEAPANRDPAAASATDANGGSRMILDEAALLEECDNDKALLSRMVEIFDRDARERLPRLREAVRAGAAVTVKEEAHALKGGIGTFYAKAAYETAYDLEKMGADGNLSNAQATLEALESQIRSLRRRLEELISILTAAISSSRK